MAVTIATSSQCGVYQGFGARCLFDVSGNLYCVVQSTGTVRIHVYKSTDHGANWTEQDSAHVPTSIASRSFSAWYHTDGKIYVFLASASTTMSVSVFNTATDLWTTALTGNATTTLVNVGGSSVRIGVRSDNNVIVAYNKNDGGAVRQVYYNRYASGSWQGETAVTAEAGATNLIEMVVDGSDYTTFIWMAGTADDATMVTLSPTNVLGTTTDIDTSIATADLNLHSLTAEKYDNAGTDTILATYTDSTNELDGTLLALEQATPGQSIQGNISATSTTNPVQKGSVSTLKSPVNGDLVAIWTQTGGTVINYDRYHAASWGTDTNFATGLTQAVVAQAITHNGGIVLVYQSSTSVFFDNFEIGGTSVLAVVATATALAAIPVGIVTALPPVSTATALATVPIPMVIPVAPAATATALANVVTIGPMTLLTTVATATASAKVPTVLVVVVSAVATATALATTPVPMVIVVAPASTATAQAYPPLIGPITLIAPAATATALATTPTILVLIPAVTATASAAANTPVGMVIIFGATATATATANVPLLKILRDHHLVLVVNSPMRDPVMATSGLREPTIIASGMLREPVDATSSPDARVRGDSELRDPVIATSEMRR